MIGPPRFVTYGTIDGVRHGHVPSELSPPLLRSTFCERFHTRHLWFASTPFAASRRYEMSMWSHTRSTCDCAQSRQMNETGSQPPPSTHRMSGRDFAPSSSS